MATPAFRAAGAVSSGLSTVTPGLPTGHVADDILLCFVQTSNQNAATVPTNATSGTWSELPFSPQGVGTAAAAGAVGLRTYWMRDTGATIGTVTVPDSGDHTLAFICAYSGCATSGNPWDVSTGTHETGTGTTTTLGGAIPTRANDLIVLVIANAVDSTTAQFSSVLSSGNLDSTPTNRTPASSNTTSGTGGGLTVLDAPKSTPGSIGLPSCTMASSSANYASMTIALKTSAMTFSVTGTLSSIGAFAKSTNRILTAALSFIGSVVKLTNRRLAGAASIPLINEDCEGTGTPAGWTNVGSPNWDYTAAPLSGSQSLFVSNNGVATAGQYDFTNQSEYWIYFMMNLSGSTTGGGQQIMGLRPNGGGSPLLQLNLNNSLRLGFASGGSASPATAIVIGTTYHVWLHCKAGTGANGILDCGFSTTGIRPTSGGTYAQLTNGTLTASFGRLIMGNPTVSATWDSVFDNIRVSTVQIGDNGALPSSAPTFSFSGNLDNQTNKLLTAALSFIGAASKAVSKAFSATLSFIGDLATLLISTLHTLAISGALSFTGATTRSTARQLTASVSFVGAITKRTSRIVSAALTFSGAVVRRVARILTAALSFIGTLQKTPAKSLAATLSFIGSMTKSIAKSFTATLSFIGALSRSIARALTGTLSFIGAFNKRISRTLSATLSFIGSLLHSISRSLTATLSFSGSTVKQTSRALSATLSFIGSTAKQASKALSGTLSFIGSLARSLSYIFTASLSFVGSAAKRSSRSLSATLSFIGSISKQVSYSRALSATLSFVGSITKQTSKALNGALSFIGSLSRSLSYVFTASLSFIGSATKQSSRSLAATLSFIGALSKQAAKFLTGALSFTGSISKTISRSFAATLSFLGDLASVLEAGAHSFLVSLAATLSFAGNSTKSTARSLTGSLSFIGVVTRQIPKLLTAALSFLGATTKQTNRSVTGALSFIGALTKRASKLLTGAISFVGSVVANSVMVMAFTAALSFAGSLTKATSHLLSGTVSFIGFSNRVVRRALAAALSLSGSIRKSTARALSAALSFVGAMTSTALQVFLQALTATLSFTGQLTTAARFVRALIATLSFAGNLSRSIGKSLSSALSFIGGLTKETSRLLSGTLGPIGTFVAHKITQFIMLFTATLSFHGSLLRRLGRIIPIVIETITRLVKIVVGLFATQGIKIEVPATPILSASINVPQNVRVIKIVVPGATSTVNIQA